MSRYYTHDRIYLHDRYDIFEKDDEDESSESFGREDRGTGEVKSDDLIYANF